MKSNVNFEKLNTLIKKYGQNLTEDQKTVVIDLSEMSGYLALIKPKDIDFIQETVDPRLALNVFGNFCAGVGIKMSNDTGFRELIYLVEKHSLAVIS